MKPKIILPILLLISLILTFAIIQTNKTSDSKKETKREEMVDVGMKLTSQSFTENGKIPSKYTCDGDNINPQLSFSDVPKNTVSLSLIVDDPDAPMGNWVHWLLWNIDPAMNGMDENSIPSGAIQGLTDFGENKYGGPCPPNGTHKYQFKLYALDMEIDIPENSKKIDLENSMKGHILEESMLVGTYERS